MDEKKLEVKDLVISFKTDNGLVQAVRDISFDLYKGETLCIVGESGSGKSVTSKAIMGILANNAIVEKGSIIYEGENLLNVSEDEFHKIRGHKIGMIFQDPLSSLNPIMRIGKQITEATLINANKIKRKYNDLISKESMAYKNAIAKTQISITKAKNNFLLFKTNQQNEIKNAKSKEEKQQIFDKIKKEKLALNQVIAEEKAKLNEVLPVLKQKLSERKKSAKIEIKQYKAELQSAYLQKVDAINKEYNIEEKKKTYLNTLAGLDKASPNYSEESAKLKQNFNAVETEYKEKLAVAKSEYIDNLKITRAEAKRRAIEIMKEVGIPFPEKRYRQYPFEFSGGMRQRIVIAIALTANPDILICDEPTTALDVTIQAQILELINRLKKERNLSCIFITHDLGVVANMADRVAVMYAGKIVEYGLVNEIFFEPKHPYTWALLSSIPDVDSKERLEAIPGTPPDMIYPPVGDAFASRSKYAMQIDFKYQPPFFKISDTHYAATWLLHKDAPKVEMPKIVSERIRIALSNDAEALAKSKEEEPVVEPVKEEKPAKKAPVKKTAPSKSTNSKKVKEESSNE